VSSIIALGLKFLAPMLTRKAGIGISLLLLCTTAIAGYVAKQQYDGGIIKQQNVVALEAILKQKEEAAKKADKLIATYTKENKDLRNAIRKQKHVVTIAKNDGCLDTTIEPSVLTVLR